MSKVNHSESCCRFLSGQTRTWCQNNIKRKPVVIGPQIKDSSGWTKIFQCRNAQIRRHIITRASEKKMKQVAKAVKSVTKSDGIVAGALLLFLVALGAGMDSAARQHSVLLKTRHPKRTEKLPVAKWKTLRGVKTLVVNTWKLNDEIQSACYQKRSAETCVKKLKAVAWKKIRENAGKHPIIRINICSDDN